MKMGSDDNWLRKKAAQGDGCYVSAGAGHIPPTEAELNQAVAALTLALRHVVRRSGLAGFGSRGEKEVWFQDAEEALTKSGREDLLREHDAIKDAEIRRLRELCGRVADVLKPELPIIPLALVDELRTASEVRI